MEDSPGEPKKMSAKFKWSLLSVAVVAMIMIATLLPGPLDPTVRVKAEFGTPYDTDLYIYQVTIQTDSSDINEARTFTWDVFQNPNEVMEIDAIVPGGGTPPYMNVWSITVVVNCYDISLFKDSNAIDNSYVKIRIYNPKYSSWGTWQYAYCTDDDTTALVYILNLGGVYWYPNDNGFQIQVELWGTMAG